MRKFSGTLFPPGKNTEPAKPTHAGSRKQSILANSGYDDRSSDRLDLAEWIVLLLFLIIGCVWAIGRFLGYIESPGIWVGYFMAFSAGILGIEKTIASFTFRNYDVEKEKKSTLASRRRERVDAIIRWQQIFFFLLCSFYMFRLDKVIYRHADSLLQIAEMPRKFIAEIMLWIMSGIVGNFAYDILKRITRKSSVPDPKNTNQ